MRLEHHLPLHFLAGPTPFSDYTMPTTILISRRASCPSLICSMRVKHDRVPFLGPAVDVDIYIMAYQLRHRVCNRQRVYPIRMLVSPAVMLLIIIAMLTDCVPERVSLTSFWSRRVCSPGIAQIHDQSHAGETML